MSQLFSGLSLTHSVDSKPQAAPELSLDNSYGPVQDGSDIAARDSESLGCLLRGEFFLHAQFVNPTVRVREHRDHLSKQLEQLSLLCCYLRARLRFGSFRTL